ncbi:MAG: hypothetical protein U0992_05270 [Planctomycetaceae bacterium]
MSLSVIVPIAVFLGITIAVWAIIGMFGEQENRASERLDELKDPSRRAQNAAKNNTGVSSAFKKAAPALSKVLQPKTELEENALKVRLSNAGYNSPNAPVFFLAIKLGCLLAGVTFGGGFGAFKYGMNYNGLASLVVGGGLGFYLPEIIVRILRKQRMDRVFLSLPDALDLLVVCVEAELGLDAAMRAWRKNSRIPPPTFARNSTSPTSSCRWAAPAAKCSTISAFAPASMT